MQSMTRKQEFCFQLRRPACFDEFQIRPALASAINFVTDQRMTDLRGMQTNLMGPSGPRLGPQQSELLLIPLETLLDCEIGFRRCPALIDAAFQPHRRIAHLPLPDDRRINCGFFPFRPTSHDREVFLADGATLHGQAEIPRALAGQREQNESARLPVKARDNRDLPAVGQLVGQQLTQPVPQSRCAIRSRGMREQTGRFVHHDPIITLGHHTEVVLRPPRGAENLLIWMISLRHVSRIYPSPAGEVHALRDVSLDIAPHSFCAVTGPSGCGKSTLLNLLGGLDQPTSGQITVEGLALHGAGEAELTAYRRERLGIIFQFFNLLPAMTAVENVELPLLLRGDSTKQARARAGEMLELVGLTPRAGAFPHQMSGGEMQRAAVARALVHRPALVLADEPTGNLDSDNAARILELFQKIASQRLATLIMVTHSPEAAAAANRQIPLMDGRLST